LDSFEVKDIEFKTKVQVAKVNESFEHLVELAVTQNFIPLVDDLGFFIGILRRQELIKNSLVFCQLRCRTKITPCKRGESFFCYDQFNLINLSQAVDKLFFCKLICGTFFS